MRELLLDLFLYDRWANERWIGVLEQFPNAEPARKTMEHILWAQQTWLNRVLNDETDLGPDLMAESARLHQAWRELVGMSDPTAYISYTMFNGETATNLFEEIALHVINHGSYERGRLRGLAQAQGFEGFPESDLIRHYRGESGSRD